MKYIYTLMAESAVDYVIEASSAEEADKLFSAWRDDNMHIIMKSLKDGCEIVEERIEKASDIYSNDVVDLFVPDIP